MTLTLLCTVDDVPTGQAMRVELAEIDVAVVRVADEIFAMEDVCSHAEFPLSEGDVDGCTIECALHGSRFDLRTGKSSGPPATAPINVFPVSVLDGDVYIELEN
ncbi:MAG: non-heme iron oxygenase ferredoxin subunit [Actinomycetota bacterium]